MYIKKSDIWHYKPRLLLFIEKSKNRLARLINIIRTEYITLKKVIKLSVPRYQVGKITKISYQLLEPLRYYSFSQ